MLWLTGLFHLFGTEHSFPGLSRGMYVCMNFYSILKLARLDYAGTLQTGKENH